MKKEELDQILLDNNIIFIDEYKDRYMYRSPIYGGDNWNYNRYLVSKEKKADEII